MKLLLYFKDLGKTLGTNTVEIISPTQGHRVLVLYKLMKKGPLKMSSAVQSLQVFHHQNKIHFKNLLAEISIYGSLVKKITFNFLLHRVLIER